MGEAQWPLHTSPSLKDRLTSMLPASNTNERISETAVISYFMDLVKNSDESSFSSCILWGAVTVVHEMFLSCMPYPYSFYEKVLRVNTDGRDLRHIFYRLNIQQLTFIMTAIILSFLLLQVISFFYHLSHHHIRKSLCPFILFTYTQGPILIYPLCANLLAILIYESHSSDGPADSSIYVIMMLVACLGLYINYASCYYVTRYAIHSDTGMFALNEHPFSPEDVLIIQLGILTSSFFRELPLYTLIPLIILYMSWGVSRISNNSCLAFKSGMGSFMLMKIELDIILVPFLSFLSNIAAFSQETSFHLWTIQCTITSLLPPTLDYIKQLLDAHTLTPKEYLRTANVTKSALLQYISIYQNPELIPDYVRLAISLHVRLDSIPWPSSAEVISHRTCYRFLAYQAISIEERYIEEGPVIDKAVEKMSQLQQTVDSMVASFWTFHDPKRRLLSDLGSELSSLTREASRIVSLYPYSQKLKEKYLEFKQSSLFISTNSKLGRRDSILSSFYSCEFHSTTINSFARDITKDIVSPYKLSYFISVIILTFISVYLNSEYRQSLVSFSSSFASGADAYYAEVTLAHSLALDTDHLIELPSAEDISRILNISIENATELRSFEVLGKKILFVTNELGKKKIPERLKNDSCSSLSLPLMYHSLVPRDKNSQFCLFTEYVRYISSNDNSYVISFPDTTRVVVLSFSAILCCIFCFLVASYVSFSTVRYLEDILCSVSPDADYFMKERGNTPGKVHITFLVVCIVMCLLCFLTLLAFIVSIGMRKSHIDSDLKSFGIVSNMTSTVFLLFSSLNIHDIDQEKYNNLIDVRREMYSQLSLVSDNILNTHVDLSNLYVLLNSKLALLYKGLSDQSEFPLLEIRRITSQMFPPLVSDILPKMKSSSMEVIQSAYPLVWLTAAVSIVSVIMMTVSMQMSGTIHGSWSKSVALFVRKEMMKSHEKMLEIIGEHNRLDAINVPVIIVDSTKVITGCNLKAEKLLMLTSGQLVGQNLSELFDAEGKYILFDAPLNLEILESYKDADMFQLMESSLKSEPLTKHFKGFFRLIKVTNGAMIASESMDIFVQEIDFYVAIIKGDLSLAKTIMDASGELCSISIFFGEAVLMQGIYGNLLLGDAGLWFDQLENKPRCFHMNSSFFDIKSEELSDLGDYEVMIE